ncbi:CBS-domain-containing protein [Rickenella mellea]|uniref:CBS-domain-containing protein n=1 Tax=Rickenella mellea TaxID=50990 RepID=A0A4Y7QNK2_9AGAM|nr:CBS-domain-containing protein [Rickenella mellea]
MSRIPVPAHSPSLRPATAHTSSSPVPFPDRAVSPIPPSRQQTSASASMSSLSGYSNSVNDTRKKQSKRDEAIRKKIESELARKRTISTHGQQRSKRGGKVAVAKGTVAALKPSPALTVPESITVSDASQLCAAKRTDCVLVVDDEEGLSGIFTAKDLAYRVSAEGLDPRSTPVSVIMTRHPMVTKDTTSATEALQLMVDRHFRHLPVCNEDGDVVGILDITKVFHEALAKVERSSSASERLYAALNGVQSELGPGMTANPQAAAMLAYVDALREKTALPDLTTVMDSRTQPATVHPKTTVKEAVKLMKEYKTTAVCVMDNTGPGGKPEIKGIFTSKDVVLRVIAAGLEPSRCSVIRVMTPHPDVARPTMSVQDALKKMHAGHYLNLPVVEDDGRLVAIVDVLKLTYATLEQMNAMSAEAGATDSAGGPMWGRFFDSIGQNDNESAISGSNIPTDIRTPPPYPDSPTKGKPQSPEVHPNDSASVVGEDVDSAAPGRHPAVGLSSLGGTTAQALPIDDGTFVFKFRTPSGRTHRFQARNDDSENLRDIISGKLSTDPFFVDAKIDEGERPDPNDFQLSYTDADGDTVLITSDADVTDAVKIARNQGSDRVVLFVQGNKSWDDAGAKESVAKAQQIASAAVETAKEIDKADAVIPTASPDSITSTPVHVKAADDLFGIPRDLLLPASIGALAVAILGIFAISRASRY